MRSIDGKLLSWIRCSVVTGALLAGFAVPRAPAQTTQQQQQTPFPPPPRTSNGRVPFGSEDENAPDPAMRHAQEEAVKKRNDQRQKEIVADTNKLLQLSQQLKEEVDKSTKETLSVSVIKKAEEIEKLARSVKDRMKAP